MIKSSMYLMQRQSPSFILRIKFVKNEIAKQRRKRIALRNAYIFNRKS